MKFSWKNQKRPILALAPMAGYTDSAFRQLVKSIEPKTICFTEFTCTEGIVYNSKNTFRQLDFNPKKEKPLIVQIFGKKPEHFATSAKVLEELGADAIDINMGCPAKKVVSSDHGSALLKNPDLAAEIVAATKNATALPVSVKTRIGISEYDPDWLIDFCKKLEKAGADLISIHGRTAKQMYKGLANWNAAYEVKKNLKIPVIGNGDIASAKDALEKLQNLDGVMVGRATIGNPWLMAEIRAAFEGKTYKKPETFEEKLPILIKHCELNVETKGEKRGMLEMRKHLAGAVKGFPGASEYRAKVVHLNTLKEAKQILNEISNHIKNEQKLNNN
ncbi:tRNA dihydrouridine synthase DusB [Patescibacteria group bacterium]|nr:tRNA dihydrouridine synthase DusB [Patescibacteria group bacterium]